MHHHFSHFCVITSAREYRKVVKRTVKKTMSLRKQILVSTSAVSQTDEVVCEPENVADPCAMCGKESTGKRTDLWIQCDRYLHLYFKNIYFLLLVTIKKLITSSMSKLRELTLQIV